MNHDKTISIESDQSLLKQEITILTSKNEELKKELEERTAIFQMNVDELRRQLSGKAFGRLVIYNHHKWIQCIAESPVHLFTVL